MEDVRKWLEDNPGSGDGYGYGDGSGYGSGYGDDYGSGYGCGCSSGDGYGYGDGDGYGDGSGHGNDYGSGSGYGYGSGCGDDYGSGSGDGYGRGSGLKRFNGMDIYRIDGVETIITHTKKSFARGYILNRYFTLSSCFIIKGQGYFAHGKTLKEARNALIEKIFGNMDTEEAIEKFLEKFKHGEKYPGTDFFEWHHYLTGSCLMGRELFVKNRGLDLEATYTVEEFIDICKNDYGGQVIKQLKEKWEEQT